MSGSSSSTVRIGSEIVGQMAGEYRLRRKLGEGSFGAVYEAEHPLLRRRAAVKVLHHAAGIDSQSVQRFISEAQAVNQVRSPYIVDVFSFGKLADGRYFYVMDLLDGEPLDVYLKRERRCSVPIALQLLRPIGEALDAAHAVGIVHRDLKPQNLYLAWCMNGDTVPKLLDFGTAKLLDASLVLTMSGTTIGTPLYMSPEQARAQPVDGRSDVYALGVLTYQLLTGELPITGSSTFAVLAAHVMTTPPRMSDVTRDLSPELDQAVIHMLEKDPNARPATAGAAMAELAAAAERAGHTLAPGPLRLPRPPARPAEDDHDTAVQTGPPTAADGACGARDAATPVSTVVARRVLGWPVMAMLAAVGAGLTYIATVVMSGTSHAPSSAGSGPSVEPPAVASARVALVATVEPHAARTVEWVVEGAPLEARVVLDGKVLGPADAPLSLPFGNGPLELTIVAPGYETAAITVVPDRSTTTSVSLRKRAPFAAPKSAVPRDLENPF
jgi:serine/threonine-protein kinase